MPRFFGLSTSAITAGTALIALVFLGLALLLVLAAYSLASAVVAIVPVIYVDARREWDVTGEHITYLVALLFAFFVSGAAAFGLDLLLGTHVSAPAMIAALDFVQWEHARPEPLIQSVSDYYAVALGPTPQTWLRFLAVHAAMVVVFATMLFRATPDQGPEPVPPLKRRLRMLGLSAVAIGASSAVAFPLLVQVMIWLRSLHPTVA
jgi:hypothetical protein